MVDRGDKLALRPLFRLSYAPLEIDDHLFVPDAQLLFCHLIPGVPSFGVLELSPGQDAVPSLAVQLWKPPVGGITTGVFCP